MARWVVAVVLAGVAYGFQAPALASEMRFEPAGDALIATGMLQRDSFARFRAAADAHPGARRVIFDSPGGLVTAGVALGAAIRERGLDTGVKPGSACASACVHALAGGVEREVPETARVTIHRSHALLPDGRIVELPAERRAGLLAYLMGHYRAMGIDDTLVALADLIPPATERALGRDVLAATRLATR
jgi:hypothetical protein